MTCHMETCTHWSGDGCVCAVMDIEPEVRAQFPDNREGRRAAERAVRKGKASK